jgi:hypothetical protein
MGIKRFKQMSKEEFMQQNGATEELYSALQNSQEGYIRIWKEDKSVEEHGYTEAFGEGISVRLDNMQRWYITSIIQKINWEEKYFDTLNSRYYFEFIKINEDD